MLSAFEAQQETGHVISDSEVFFSIVTLRSSNMTEADSAGAKADTADVMIRICPSQPTQLHGDAVPDVRADKARTSTMNLRAWCQPEHLRMALSSSRRWRVIGSSSTPCIIPAAGRRRAKSLSAIPRLQQETP